MNLSFNDATNGNLLLHCFSARCSINEIAKSLNLKVSDFFISSCLSNKEKFKFCNDKQCIKHYRILTIANNDVENGRRLSDKDKVQVIESINFIKNNNFTDSKYKYLMEVESINLACKRFKKKGWE